MNNPVKLCFAKTKALSITRIICAVLTLIPIVMMIAADKKIGISRIISSDGKEGLIIFLYSLPFILLIGMGIFWAITFSRTAKPDDDGKLLRACTVVSQILAVLGTILFIYLIVVFAKARKGSGFSYGPVSTKEFFTFAMVFAIAGLICIPLTSVARTRFYMGAQKTFAFGVPVSGAGFYSAMKTVTSFIKIFLVFLLTLFMLDGIDRGSKDAVWIIFQLSVILSLFTGAVAGLMEARFAMSCKRVFG